MTSPSSQNLEKKRVRASASTGADEERRLRTEQRKNLKLRFIVLGTYISVTDGEYLGSEVFGPYLSAKLARQAIPDVPSQYGVRMEFEVWDLKNVTPKVQPEFGLRSFKTADRAFTGLVDNRDSRTMR